MRRVKIKAGGEEKAVSFNMIRNLKILLVGLAVLMALLVFRLAYIQLFGGKELAQAAHAQSLISLEGSNTRGIIYDRNGAPLVADKKQYVYIIREKDFDYQTGKLLKSIGAREVSSNNKGYFVYSSKKYDKAAGKKLSEKYGAYILEASARYSDNQTASNLIGYVNKKDSSGAAGLELMFDKELSLLNRKIYAAADVRGHILPGRGLVITSDRQKDSSVKEGVRITLDKELQEAVEDIADESGRECSVVILDVKSGGIAAMASTPGFDPNNIEEYLDGNGHELLNKATQGEYAPGSVFKIVVAAAALEDGISVDKSFVCSGSVALEDVSIGCKTGGAAGHGEINIEDAFAQSCNSYFVQLGREIGSEKIISMAEKLGFGKKTLPGYPQESKGHIMTLEESFGSGIGNFSIGQGQTLVTPLQIAHMTGVIASEGRDRGVHILMEDEASGDRVINEDTAKQVMDMMKKVTQYGTASSMGIKDDKGNPMASVKTGTAEYGRKEEGRSNGWVTGFSPCDKPEYVITVLAEDSASGTSGAGPVYKSILEYLKESGCYSEPVLT